MRCRCYASKHPQRLAYKTLSHLVQDAIVSHLQIKVRPVPHGNGMPSEFTRHPVRYPFRSPTPSLRAQRSNLVRDLDLRGVNHGLGCFVAPEPAPRNDGKGLVTTLLPEGHEWLPR